MTILCLETSTKACSVALGQNGKLLSLQESLDENYSHSEKLTLFIEDVCKQAKIQLKDVDAIAVSKGPGSYTGLRIGVSTAKGLCYALDKPLIAINSLEAMAAGVIQKNVAALGLSPNPSPQGEGDSPIYHTAKRTIWEGLKEYSREMRKKPTEAEALLWEKIRAKKIGYKIRRQHAIDKFICDFVCLEKQLAIELDGKIHDFQKEEDRLREDIIGDKRFSILRFSNDEVIGKMDFVISEIKRVLDAKSLPPLRGGKEGGAKKLQNLFCPMIDARRMEVYTAVYDEKMKEVFPTSAEIIDETFLSKISTPQYPILDTQYYFFGDGAAKCKQIISHPNAIFIADADPSAKSMLPIAEKYFSEKRFEDVAYFEPFYLKDFVDTSKKSASP